MTDWRLPQHRQEVFQDFYEFHLRYRSHPGAVYYVAPYLAEMQGWTEEQKLWWAVLNGNTQNPVTTWLIMREAPEPGWDGVKMALAFVDQNYAKLEWDTDRRHHKKALPDSLGYWSRYWMQDPAMWKTWSLGGWENVWAMAQSIPSFGRLSGWSFTEYLAIFGYSPEPDSFLLEDMSGSRSHRTGAGFVMGREDVLDVKSPGYLGDAAIRKFWIPTLNGQVENLLHKARKRAFGKPWFGDVNRHTLESALCTYKSWHRPRRRYPNVYNDLFHDRIRRAEHRFPAVDFGELWSARAAALPPYLRQECCPNDPGAVAVKQDWYRINGQPVMMSRDYPKYDNPLDQTIWSEVVP